MTSGDPPPPARYVLTYGASASFVAGEVIEMTGSGRHRIMEYGPGEFTEITPPIIIPNRRARRKAAALERNRK